MEKSALGRAVVTTCFIVKQKARTSSSDDALPSIIQASLGLEVWTDGPSGGPPNFRRSKLLNQSSGPSGTLLQKSPPPFRAAISIESTDI